MIRAKLLKLYDPLAIVAALPLSVVVVVGAILSLRSHAILRQNRDLVVHTYQVIDLARSVLLDVADAETGQRGFLLSGEDRFLEPYQRVEQVAVPQKLSEFKHLVRDNPTQAKRIAQLERLLSIKFQELGTTISVRRHQGFEASRKLVLSQFGKNVMDQARLVIAAVVSSEQELLARRSAEVQHDEVMIVRIGVLTAATSTLVRLTIAFWRKRLWKAPTVKQREISHGE